LQKNQDYLGLLGVSVRLAIQPRKISFPEIPKEVQGPHRTVGPKIIMMMIEYIIK
jgi:hypothetical protein